MGRVYNNREGSWGEEGQGLRQRRKQRLTMPCFPPRAAPLRALVPGGPACPGLILAGRLSRQSHRCFLRERPGLLSAPTSSSRGNLSWAVTSASRRLSQGAQGGKRGGVPAAVQGGLQPVRGWDCHHKAWGGRTMGGAPRPPRGRCCSKLPVPAGQLFCMCVYWGVRGILLFAFVSLFFLFGLWLAPGWWGRVEGRRAGKEGLENFRRLAWDPDRDGICEEFVRGNLGAS